MWRPGQHVDPADEMNTEQHGQTLKVQRRVENMRKGSRVHGTVSVHF